jgi:hypothetical protein
MEMEMEAEAEVAVMMGMMETAEMLKKAAETAQTGR